MQNKPTPIPDKEYRYDAFENGCVLLNKKKNHLPVMGWNSWNAFGSGNTERLTKDMADALVELGLAQLGYQYVVLDDGCYKSERVDGKLSNEAMKFPGGFKALADYVHAKGLKFGMYNDIGTNLCAGAAVGTCGHEMTDARSYMDWGVDFLKVDNCYYLWDNATFSDAANVKYVYTPNIRSVRIVGDAYDVSFQAVTDGILTGRSGEKRDTYVTGIGTIDGTGPQPSPVGTQSSELEFRVNVPKTGEYLVYVTYATGQEDCVGSWLQIAVGNKKQSRIFYDDFLQLTESAEEFRESDGIPVSLEKGENCLRFMNHRRQENTLNSYAKLLEGLNLVNPGHDVILSICEWGKTQPQNWGYKVGDSWRILNDITFCVGADGDPGTGSWSDDYTASVTSQYNKAVIMDEYAGLDKGWNDPDMLMVGMNGLTDVMCKTHFSMWCMMNAPLMLGMDLRRVKKGDGIWKIISNKELIALNQDSLGIQAKRVFCSLNPENPDTSYIVDNNRVDILAKPLADGSLALSFINLSGERKGEYRVNAMDLIRKIGDKMINQDTFAQAEEYRVLDLWSEQVTVNATGSFGVDELTPYDSVTIRVTPVVR
ncbi:MAG: alpha-galactosidase [Lachnospiraceae bacterium]|nr:alpha-galactosidase [Lachnospiraceae bacterium]MDY5103115.1 alpha-galactosidase [Agathobacter sp.]MDY5521845.1 alpha-galactosidase [Agathobacter sp.]